ncbi:MAG: nucleotidyl transferase AbiEii/AbiGii toxin family protein [Kiritimatiellae bacterium]|nr:nucleotidyl transferase AbiEii/AbiGii toxin family protein [Kiritimatiellia bacterium]
MKIKPPFLHEDADYFRSCIAFTAREQGFDSNLVEKDYFCSLVLASLSGVEGDFVFKGGTCFGKVFLNFFRLSEDLDFSISLPYTAKRSQRRKAIAVYKSALVALPEQLPGIELGKALIGRNESRQYVAVVEYASLITPGKGRIKIDIGLREELLAVPSRCLVQTLLVDSVTGVDVLPPFHFLCIDQQEAWAEKTRAALCRRKPAIRDFFDMDYALREGNVNLRSSAFLALVQRKVMVPGNDPVTLSPERKASLELQTQTELRPVLRSRDFEQFDLDRIWKELVTLVNRLEKT